MTNAEARFNQSLRPRKPEGSLGRTAQDVHLDSHTAPELCRRFETRFFILSQVQREELHYNKAISCKSYMQLLIQDVYSISSKTCQL